MKKWIIPVGITIVICILAINMAMPISLAAENRIEVEGALQTEFTFFPNLQDYYSLGDLNKGDKVSVVITELRGSGEVGVALVNTPIFGQLEEICNKIGLSGEGGALCIPCMCFSTISDALNFVCSPSFSNGEIGKISSTGEEKILEIPSDGVYYLELYPIGGDVHYKGYIEVIKGNTEA